MFYVKEMMPMVLTKHEARMRIAKRIAQELQSEDKKMFINTGVGIPTMVPQFIKSDNVFVQSENGILGVGQKAEKGEIDPQLINAGREHITEAKGCSYFDSSVSFSMIRGGHIDVTIIGAFEVDQNGNIANWIIPNGRQLGVGGAMDLVSGAKKVFVAMQHITKQGKPRIKKKCSLPITGYNAVDLLVTEYAVFTFENDGMILEEIAPELTLEQLKKITEAEFKVSPNLTTMRAT
jgi:3-oxoacid CoA-transferase B subunit